MSLGALHLRIDKHSISALPPVWQILLTYLLKNVLGCKIRLASSDVVTQTNRITELLLGI